MAYWLLKSEPDAWSWDQMVKAGPKGTAWTGIRNHTAKLNMKKMKKGDRGFFYHSNVGKEIVGIVEVIKEAYADPTAEAGSPWVCVDVKASRPNRSLPRSSFSSNRASRCRRSPTRNGNSSARWAECNFFVMPGLVPGIHDLLSSLRSRRGWPGRARP